MQPLMEFEPAVGASRSVAPRLLHDAPELMESTAPPESETHWSIFHPDAPAGLLQRSRVFRSFVNAETEREFLSFALPNLWGLTIGSVLIPISLVVSVSTSQLFELAVGKVLVVAAAVMLVLAVVNYVICIREPKQTLPLPAGDNGERVRRVTRHDYLCWVTMCVLLVVSFSGYCGEECERRSCGRVKPFNSNYCRKHIRLYPIAMAFFPGVLFRFRAFCLCPFLVANLVAMVAARSLSPNDTATDFGFQVATQVVFHVIAFVWAWLVDERSRAAFEQVVLVARDVNAIAMRRAAMNETLQSLLPDTAVNQLSRYRPFVQSSDECVVSHFRIADFLRWSCTLQPVRVAMMMVELSRRFDERATTARLSKLRVTGDSYVACAGFGGGAAARTSAPTSFSTEEAAARTVAFAREQLVILYQVAELRGIDSVAGTVGVACGPCVGGILGVRSLWYEAAGGVLDEADRLSLHCSVGAVRVSELVHRLCVRSGDKECAAVFLPRTHGPHPAQADGDGCWRVASHEDRWMECLGGDDGPLSFPSILSLSSEPANGGAMRESASRAVVPASKLEPKPVPLAVSHVSSLLTGAGDGGLFQHNSAFNRRGSARKLEPAQPAAVGAPAGGRPLFVADDNAAAENMEDSDRPSGPGEMSRVAYLRSCVPETLLPYSRRSADSSAVPAGGVFTDEDLGALLETFELSHRWGTLCFENPATEKAFEAHRALDVGLDLFCTSCAMALQSLAFIVAESTETANVSPRILLAAGITMAIVRCVYLPRVPVPSGESLAALIAVGTPLLLSLQLQGEHVLNVRVDWLALPMTTILTFWTRRLNSLLQTAVLVVSAVGLGLIDYARHQVVPATVIGGSVVAAIGFIVRARLQQVEARLHFRALQVAEAMRRAAETELCLQRAMLTMIVPPFVASYILASPVGQLQDAKGRPGLAGACPHACILELRVDTLRHRLGSLPAMESFVPGDLLKAIELAFSAIEEALANVRSNVRVRDTNEVILRATAPQRRPSNRAGAAAAERRVSATAATENINVPPADTCGDAAAAPATIEKISVRGDVYVIGGPLCGGGSTPPLGCALKLLDLLAAVLERHVPLTAALHTDGGSSVVLGTCRYSLDFVGPATRVSRALVDAAPPGLIVMTPSFERVLRDNAVELPRRRGDFRVVRTERWSVAAVGVTRVRVLGLDTESERPPECDGSPLSLPSALRSRKRKKQSGGSSAGFGSVFETSSASSSEGGQTQLEQDTDESESSAS